MSSNYRNFQNSVPLLIIILEAAFIILFYFFDIDNDDSPLSGISYPAFQDVSHMMIFGFGFYLTFLKRYGFSSTGFNLLIIVIGVQCSMLIEGVLVSFLPNKIEDRLKRRTAVVSTTAVVISAAAVLGKINPVQLIVMTVVEVMVFWMNTWINTKFLQNPDNISMMHVHLFGAYFGLAVSSRFSEPSPRSEKNGSTPKSDLLSMLGTLFLWVFWPSFNSVLAADSKGKAIYNTYFALAVSAVTAFVLSVLTTKDGKFRMSHIRSAVLAGGVAVGYAAHSIEYPWIAMILGLLASVITILGSYCLQRCFHATLQIHDSSGVHFTFGLPAVLGAVAQVILFVIKNWTNLPSLHFFVVIHIGAFCFTISVALVTGFITGLILNLKLFKTTPVSKYFEDQFYWEFPHLGVGF
ncbi:RH-like protein isoform X2 [Phalacrocorax aristotelis]|uniref:RH-like protein isoform X2 n=1 Tax=Phalacrocorax aristotelis TaxID=126867 RepID=UPI003F4B73D2